MNSDKEKLSPSASKVILKELTTKRSSVKGQITKFKGYLDKITQQARLSNIELAELSIKLGKFEVLSTKFDVLQSEIEVINCDNLDFEIDERDNIEQELVSNIAIAKNIIETQNCLKDEMRRESIFQEAQCSFNPSNLGFKLPQIQINKFNGTYFRWLEFRDTFLNLIHNNQQIPDIHKYHYLVSYLEGDAARIISNLEVSSANYKEAWALLCSRYDNKRLLINHHLKSLFNIKPITNESETSLRFLVDHVTKNLRALSSLEQPTIHWDVLLIYMLCSKLDSTTLMKWEELRNTYNDVPTLEQFNKFLIDRADVLEALNRNKQDQSFKSISNPMRPSTNYNKNNYYKYDRAPIKSFANTTENTNKSIYPCVICNENNHKIYDCSIFKSKNIKDRLADVERLSLCLNCLRKGHSVTQCRLGSCRECKRRHNTLIHQTDPTIMTNAATCKQGSNDVLLSTALIEVSNPKTNEKITVRAFLDCGSQWSFISKSLMQQLSLESNPIDVLSVVGISNKTADTISESCTAQITSLNNPFNIIQSFFVLNELTGKLPNTPINLRSLNLPKNIKLADPLFYQPGSIDVLIGSDIFWDIIGNEQRSLGPNNPRLINSKLGWLVGGPMSTQNTINRKYSSINCNHAIIANQSHTFNIDNMLTKFWEIEDFPQKCILSEDEIACEKHFTKNTIRLDSGRFCVKLPTNETPDCLGDSYYTAKKRFLNLERRFRKNPNLKSQYVEFIREYADLGHLSKSNIQIPNSSYFLCHHAVFKDNSESSKIRVVFDGSASTSSGFSVNDILMVGPNIQDSLISILIRARQYKYLLTGDIEKMYRQVQVHDNDRNLQLILWREDESSPIETLQLNTLTYGTASASYLSTRCLWQAGEECHDDTIKTIIQKDFYVDDLITGTDDESSLRYIKDSVSKALNSACFKLRKFKSNLPTIFENTIDTQDNLTLSESSSTLGIGWSPSNDSIHFPIKTPPQDAQITKRFIMSHLFKIFDPLGLLSPCIIQPKMLLQKLWLLKLGFDEPVPQDIKQLWDEFVNNLIHISNLQIPRRVLCDSPKLIEIHSFSDASLSALGACVYMRSIDGNDVATVTLLCAKSKVSPLKPVTIPRLELCAALLATRLCKSVLDALRFKPSRVVHWCDASVVLGWINSNPGKLKTFVANRVVEILETTQASSWRYVPTHHNPADLISRGVNASQLQNRELWWSGPSFLRLDESDWPILKSNTACEVLPEIKNNTLEHIFKTKNDIYKYLPDTMMSNPVTVVEPVIKMQNYSKLNRLQRTLAYIKRFIHNTKNINNKLTGNLSIEELDDSFTYLCAISQRQSFSVEYNALIQNKSLHTKSKILPLSPFLDENKLIRVGGRIDASNYSYEKKHPILLDSSHHLTKLLFEQEHLRNLHAGPQLLLATVRESVWPVNGRHLARRTVHNCVRCRRIQGKTLCPKMGDLPSQRITPDYPFISVGLDYAGPFYILNRKGRGAKLTKCYLCLFICLRYKCLHLEAVSDLTKDAFIMTLRRFVARRGKPLQIFSDNGSNLVAAAKELGEFIKSNIQPLSDFATHEKIKFYFTPTYAPHFGGIWEAGVKSSKNLIKRVMGNTHLTFEEISTLFAQVESILNSRPLCPLSSSPDDFHFLTPGHFLIGRSLTALPSPALEDHNPNTLQRYARLEQIRQHFWQRWQKEYICELQQRKKWRTNISNLNIGDLVLLQEDHVPPLSWRLGRVLRLFPGPDKISRVADIATTRGCVRRPLVRICPLPTAEDLRS